MLLTYERSSDIVERLLELNNHLSALVRDLTSSSEMDVSGTQRSGSAFRFDLPTDLTSASDSSARLIREQRPALPDPRLIRTIIRQRQLRGRYFKSEHFADPAWDILLDLTAARAEHRRVSVTSLCIASGVPPTTALRWISQMEETGVLQRTLDDVDRRRAFIALSDEAAYAMARYFREIGKSKFGNYSDALLYP